MEPSHESLESNDRIARLREMEFPPEPPKVNRRKGTLRIARLSDDLCAAGKTQIINGKHTLSTWEILCALRKENLTDLWPKWSTEDGPIKTLGDCMGHGGLRCGKVEDAEGKERYVLPDGGFTPEYCEQNHIELVDDPKIPKAARASKQDWAARITKWLHAEREEVPSA